MKTIETRVRSIENKLSPPMKGPWDMTDEEIHARMRAILAERYRKVYKHNPTGEEVDLMFKRFMEAMHQTPISKEDIRQVFASVLDGLDRSFRKP
jgi:hypothetical protein